MPTSKIGDRFSAEDAVFFYLDTNDMPLHIGSVMVFDGPIPLEGCIDLITSRLPLVPRYRQRIVVPPFNLGHPTWEWDPEFDIRRHIRSVRLKRGTEAELQDLTGSILSEMMDRSKPMWDLTLVEGIKGGLGAIIGRVHHCLVDGVAGLDILNVLFDPATTPPGETMPGAGPLPDAASSLVDALLSSYSEMFDRLLSIESAVVNIAEGVAAQGVAGLAPLLKSVPDLLGSVDRLPFNKPCGGARKLVWTEIPMSDISAIREVCEGKLNDIALTVVTAAIRRYTLLHRQPVKGRLLRLMVPVNIRGREGESNTGNRVSMLPVTVPLDITDPIKLLDEVRQRTETLKRSGITEVIRLAGNWVGFLPAPLQALIGPHASSLPAIIPPWNMVCTNVPGPKTPLYAVGRKMLKTYPYVPIGAEMGLNVAMESYNGTLFFGIAGSLIAAPDVDILPQLVSEAFADLCKAAGIKRSPPQGAKTTRKSKRRTTKLAAQPNGHPASPIKAPRSLATM